MQLVIFVYPWKMKTDNDLTLSLTVEGENDMQMADIVRILNKEVASNKTWTQSSLLYQVETVITLTTELIF